MLTVRLLLVLGLGLLATACAPRFVKNTDIEYTEEKQHIANLVEAYRKALTNRDAGKLRDMVSRNYFENGSTTSNPNDDYGYDGLMRLMEALKTQVKEVRYAIDIKAIEVYKRTATVDYEYEAQYLYAAGSDERWANRIDRNRLTFRKEGGKWMIIGGL
jgi:hypothetical protein